MDHGPAVELGQDNATEIKSKIGFVLFIVYLVVYGGFVAINGVKPVMMGKTVMFGVNLACVYGFGLIVLALVMGLIYNQICTGFEKRLNISDAPKDEVGEEDNSDEDESADPDQEDSKGEVDK